MAKLGSWGLPGLLVIAVLDGAGVPLPGGVDLSVILLSSSTPSRWLLFAALATAGSVLGTLFLFGVARKGGELYLQRYTASGRGAKLKDWFLHYGLLTVFIPALLPIPLPLKVFVISAGALVVGWLPFLLVLLAARIPRYVGLAYLGAQLGNESLSYLRSHAMELLLLALALFAVLFGLVKWQERRKAGIHYQS